MTIKNLIDKNLCIELKNGDKYFGKFKEIDDSPIAFSWYIFEIRNKEMIFCDGEILRIEVLE